MMGLALSEDVNSVAIRFGMQYKKASESANHECFDSCCFNRGWINGFLHFVSVIKFGNMFA